MKRYHTIISGAGPAGLACAAVLAESGRKVLVLERQDRVGPKVCAGGITWSGISRRVPADLIQRSFPEQHIFTDRQRAVINAPDPLVSTIDRLELGRWMLDRARGAGAEVRTGAPLGKISGDRLSTGGEELRFDFLVGADGSASKVRRHLGIASQWTGCGLNLFVPGDFPDMEWHLSPRHFGNGYAWIFPHRGSASIGAYVSREKMRPADLLKNFHLWAAKRGINPGRQALSAALINCDFKGWRFGNIFLAGDAAGLASPLTGEGIYPAIVSGEEVARTIIDPGHPGRAMEQMLRRQAVHHRVVRMTSGSRLACRAITETLVAGLRIGIVPFRALEMAG